MELDKNFKFRLQKVLDLKIKDEEEIKMEFAKIQQKNRYREQFRKLRK